MTDPSAANILVRSVEIEERRRGSRIMIELPISVMGIDTLGEPFRENGVTISISCYGCKYRTRRYAPKDSVVTLEIRQPQLPKASRIVHARVVWVQRPRHHRETFQIGLELEVPGNVWGIDSPPSDWFPPRDEVTPAHQAPPEAQKTPQKAPAVSPGPSPGEWQALDLPSTALEKAAIPEGIPSSTGTRELIAETVRITADAIVAEEIALIRKHFTGRLETALIETLKTFSELTAEIVNETREACRASIKEIQGQTQQIAQQACSALEQAAAHKPSSAKRRKKTRFEP